MLGDQRRLALGGRRAATVPKKREQHQSDQDPQDPNHGGVRARQPVEQEREDQQGDQHHGSGYKRPQQVVSQGRALTDEPYEHRHQKNYIGELEAEKAMGES
jgi:hypothetical protein